MVSLYMIALRNKTVTHTFLLLFENANYGHGNVTSHVSALYRSWDIILSNLLSFTCLHNLSIIYVKLRTLRGLYEENITLELNIFIPHGKNLARDDSNIENIFCLLLVQCFKDKV